MKLMDKLVIRKSREPEGNKTHILWHESKSLTGYGSKQIFKGTFFGDMLYDSMTPQEVMDQYISDYSTALLKNQ